MIDLFLKCFQLFQNTNRKLFSWIYFAEAGNSRLQGCSVREEVFEILEVLEFSKFQNIFSFLSTSRKVSVIEVLVHQQAVDLCSCAILSNGNCRCFAGYFPKFLVELFQNIVMKSSVMEFSRVPGCRVVTCFN